MARVHQELPVIVTNHIVCSLWVEQIWELNVTAHVKKNKSTAKEWRKGNGGRHCLHTHAELVAFGFPFPIPKRKETLVSSLPGLHLMGEAVRSPKGVPGLARPPGLQEGAASVREQVAQTPEAPLGAVGPSLSAA